MRSFEKELTNCLDAELSTSVASYKYAVYGGKFISLEGVGKLLSYRSEEVIFSCRGGKLTVTGSSLVIASFGGQFATVKGEITQVGWEK